MRPRRHRQGFGYAVIDMLSALAATFLVLAVTPAESPATPAPAGAPVGLLMVQLTWDLSDDADVDLWVKSPDDKPVGFMRMHGSHFDLMHDDLGRGGDPNSLNQELAAARNCPPGEYVINSVLYLDRDNRLPVKVKVEVRTLSGELQILDAQGELTYSGDEITLMRFRIGATGRLTFENNLFEPLYGENR